MVHSFLCLIKMNTTMSSKMEHMINSKIKPSLFAIIDFLQITKEQRTIVVTKTLELFQFYIRRAHLNARYEQWNPILLASLILTLESIKLFQKRDLLLTSYQGKIKANLVTLSKEIHDEYMNEYGKIFYDPK